MLYMIWPGHGFEPSGRHFAAVNSDPRQRCQTCLCYRTPVVCREPFVVVLDREPSGWQYPAMVPARIWRKDVIDALELDDRFQVADVRVRDPRGDHVARRHRAFRVRHDHAITLHHGPGTIYVTCPECGELNVRREPPPGVCCVVRSPSVLAHGVHGSTRGERYWGHLLVDDVRRRRLEAMRLSEIEFWPVFVVDVPFDMYSFPGEPDWSGRKPDEFNLACRLLRDCPESDLEDSVKEEVQRPDPAWWRDIGHASFCRRCSRPRDWSKPCDLHFVGTVPDDPREPVLQIRRLRVAVISKPIYLSLRPLLPNHSTTAVIMNGSRQPGWVSISLHDRTELASGRGDKPSACGGCGKSGLRRYSEGDVLPHGVFRRSGVAQDANGTLFLSLPALNLVTSRTRDDPSWRSTLVAES